MKNGKKEKKKLKKKQKIVNDFMDKINKQECLPTEFEKIFRDNMKDILA